MATDPKAAADSQRIDRWLWHARFARTRTGAQRLVASGHVRVNKTRVTSASRNIRIGDVLTIALVSGVKVIAISAIAEKRGSPAIAQALYEDRTPLADDGPAEAPKTPALAAPVRGKRPDRRERRMAGALKRRIGE